MITIKLAGVCVGIDNRYPYIERQCREFLCEGEAAFTVSVSEEEIREEQSFGDFSAGYCESICIYRKICEQMPAYGVFLMHASVLEVNGYAYAFSAPSGTGKSTHSVLWLKHIEGARVLNGDKPLLRLEEDGGVTAFGTPWNGKENWGANISAPLRAVCFLERGAENAIRRAPEEEAIARLAQQLYLRGNRACVNLQLALMDGFVRSIPFYVLACNISKEAALLSFGTMSAQN
jgi:hypothetical protein